MSRSASGDTSDTGLPHDEHEPTTKASDAKRSALGAARELLASAVITYGGEPVGTVAAVGGEEHLNYRECFTRDFAVSAAAALSRGDTVIVRNFLRLLSGLQARTHTLDCFEPGEGLMPASFCVAREGDTEAVVADFGQRAIASVAPVDAALWWLLTLRAHGRSSGDDTLAEEPSVRAAIERICNLYLAPRFETTPALLVPDGAYAVDRRLGVYGHPLDVQVLLFGALRAARDLLPYDHELQKPVWKRLTLLAHHVRTHYWLDDERLNVIYRRGVEEFGSGRANRFNIYADTIPTWVMKWMQEDRGYFIGNLGPARMDFRFFSIGNLLSVTTGLATAAQTRTLLDTIRAHRDDLLGQVPMKLVFPAVKGKLWRWTTGSDPKNVAWSYHNGGNWPWLTWLLAGAARHGGNDDLELARSALASSATRLHRDDWPEYYDGPNGGLLGRQARLRQTWSAAGLLAADALLHDPEADDPFAFPFDQELEDDIVDLAEDPERLEQRSHRSKPLADEA